MSRFENDSLIFLHGESELQGVARTVFKKEKKTINSNLAWQASRQKEDEIHRTEKII